MTRGASGRDGMTKRAGVGRGGRLGEDGPKRKEEAEAKGKGEHGDVRRMCEATVGRAVWEDTRRIFIFENIKIWNIKSDIGLRG